MQGSWGWKRHPPPKAYGLPQNQNFLWEGEESLLLLSSKDPQKREFEGV